MNSSGRKIHFIAIGGAAMHNLAIALKKKGYEVSGSDDEIFEPSRGRLEKHGLLPVAEGWYPEKISGNLDAVILGMHARKDNPELLEAEKKGINIYSYPEYIYQETRNKKRVVIGGSHGKTTITSMIMHVLKENGYSFDYLVGSIIEGFDTMVNLDEASNVAVIEGDEYLSSPLDPTPKFLHYKPHVAVLSGIAWDHMNVFPTLEEYIRAFRRFADSIQDEGILIYSYKDELLKNVVDEADGNIKKIPYTSHAGKILENCTYLLSGKEKIPVHFFGEHNCENAMAAKLVCYELGVDSTAFYQAIRNFKGAGKRLELKGGNAHSKMFIDFAHSPSKLKSTIDAVKQQFKDKTIVACMELHTFSSLNKAFLHEYRGTMKHADVPIVYYDPDVIKQKGLELFDKEDVIRSLEDERLMVYDHPGALKEFLLSLSYSNMILLMMSSGNFSGMGLKEIEVKFA